MEHCTAGARVRVGKFHRPECLHFHTDHTARDSGVLGLVFRFCLEASRSADAHDDIDGDMGILWCLGSVVNRELDDLVDQRMVTRLSRSGCNPRVSSAGS